MTLLFTPEQLEKTSVEDINARIVEAFQYDDFAWQKERGIRISYPKHAEGLQKVLYQCPACSTEPDGERFDMDIPVAAMYSCHIEYEYLGKYGDCIDLNTLEDTWYIYPSGSVFSVTKMARATEELYFALRRSAGRECPPGLA